MRRKNRLIRLRKRWSRRRFLGAPLALASLTRACRRDEPDEGVAALSALPVETIRDLGPYRDWEEGIVAYVRASEIPQDVGRHYLRFAAYGRWEDTPEILLRKILLSLSAVEQEDGSEIVDLLRKRIQMDFTVDERVCYLDGWYLSRTECRLAALKYLMEEGGD